MTTITSDPTLDRYLNRLRSELGKTSPAEAEEIVLELRSHVLDRVASGSSMVDALSRLGEPAALARLYRSEVEMDRARKSLSPWTVFRGALRWGMVSWIGFAVSVFGFLGYAMGIALIVSAVLKPFFPDQVGFWISGKGATLGVVDSSAGAEVLGWWIIPVGLILGCLYLIGVTLVLRWVLRNFGRIKSPRALFESAGRAGQNS